MAFAHLLVTPDGRFALFTCHYSTDHGPCVAIDVVDVATLERRRVVDDAQRPRLAGDWLLLARGPVILRVAIDRTDTRVRSEPQVVIASVEAESRRLLANRADRVGARLSPDGRFLAYTSSQTGRMEGYVEAWPTLDRKQRVSTDGGLRPIWGSTPGTLYFRSGESILSAQIDDSLRVASTRVVRDKVPASRYDADGSGERFLVAHPAGGAEPQTRLGVITDITTPRIGAETFGH